MTDKLQSPSRNGEGLLVNQPRDEQFRVLIRAAKALRAAQRDYMANRGDNAKGKVVAETAQALDDVLEHVYNPDVLDTMLALASSPSETAPTPVAYVVQVKSDGSLYSEIVPVGYSMFEHRMAGMKKDPWVVGGHAEIVPLYLSPPSARGTPDFDSMAMPEVPWPPSHEVTTGDPLLADELDKALGDAKITYLFRKHREQIVAAVRAARSSTALTFGDLQKLPHAAYGTLNGWSANYVPIREVVDLLEASPPSATVPTTNDKSSWFSSELLEAAAKLLNDNARNDVLEEAAEVCDGYSGERWKEFKTGHGPKRGDQYTQGESDGAIDCASRIRALKSGTPERGGAPSDGMAEV